MGATPKAQAMITWVRGEIYLVAFDPALGSEAKKSRPALVLQNDRANRTSLVTIVAAITSRLGPRSYPTDVVIRAPDGASPSARRLS